MSTVLDSLQKALQRLREALAAPESDLTRDASIQRFEFTFELAWKAVKEQARRLGLECRSPKGCFKLAFQQGWIDDEALWVSMLEDRNRASHTYGEWPAHNHTDCPGRRAVGRHASRGLFTRTENLKAAINPT